MYWPPIRCRVVRYNISLLYLTGEQCERHLYWPPVRCRVFRYNLPIIIFYRRAVRATSVLIPLFGVVIPLFRVELFDTIYRGILQEGSAHHVCTVPLFGVQLFVTICRYILQEGSASFIFTDSSVWCPVVRYNLPLLYFTGGQCELRLYLFPYLVSSYLLQSTESRWRTKVAWNTREHPSS